VSISFKYEYGYSMWPQPFPAFLIHLAKADDWVIGDEIYVDTEGSFYTEERLLEEAENNFFVNETSDMWLESSNFGDFPLSLQKIIQEPPIHIGISSDRAEFLYEMDASRYEELLVEFKALTAGNASIVGIAEMSEAGREILDIGDTQLIYWRAIAGQFITIEELLPVENGRKRFFTG
jgi:hypothetical protein